MARLPVLLFGKLMAARRDEWRADYETIVLESATDLLPAEIAGRIEVVASGEQLPNALVDALPALKLVACFSTGFTGIDLPYLRTRGITLTTAAGVNAHDVADHALALLLALWHRIPLSDRRVREGGWREMGDARPSLRGKRAGIVGLGRIGAAIASRLAAHEIEVEWWGPHAKPEADCERAPSLLALAQRSEMLIVASRADPANARQIDSAVLRALGPDGVLVNVSRGFLVDESALIEALRTGALGGAALDVFEDEPPVAEKWRGVPNLVLTPHIAGFTREAGEDLPRQQRENVRRYFAGEPLLTPVGNR
jgi:lactate dehydrogenase-like 2-hydroxyacid dehydrogenase